MVRVAKGRVARPGWVGVTVTSGRGSGREKNQGKGKLRVGANGNALGVAMREFMQVNGTLQRMRGWDGEELGATGILEL